MVSVGIVGLGFGGSVHAPGFQAVPNVRLHGVWSRSAERARAFAQEHSIPQVFSSWEALVDSPDIDAVSVATPPATHERIVVRALARGKAVLCEKPLALDASQARRMRDEARRVSATAMVDFLFREVPAWRFAKELLDSGDLGPLRHASLSWTVQSWSDPQRPWSWRSVRAEGGGALGAFAVHLLDYVEWALGTVERMTAQRHTAITRRPDAQGALQPVTAEDGCDLLIELASGTPVRVQVATTAACANGIWIEVQGERQTMTLASSSPNYGTGFEVRLRRMGSRELRPMPVPERLHLRQEFEDGRLGPFVRLAERFINATAAKRANERPSFEDGYRAQVLLDAAMRSAKEHTWVRIESPQGR